MSKVESVAKSEQCSGKEGDPLLPDTRTVDVRMICYSKVMVHELRLLLPLSVMMMQLQQEKLVIVPRRGMVPKKAKYT
jgi:hypothetical protein